MDAPSLIDFRGNWPPNEQDTVEAAAEEAEAAGLPAPSKSPVPPWLAVRQVVGTTSLYMASWQDADSGLVGRSAPDLADRIRRFAEAETGSPIRSDTSAPGADDRSLFQLIYESTAVAQMDEDDLRALLKKARSKNKRLGITGLLLYAHGQFLQVLEGPEEAVYSLYATIQEDQRHTNVETILTTPIPKRTFSEWAMGLENLTAVAGEAGTSDYLQTGTLRGAAEPMDALIEVLERFKRSSSQES